MDCNEAFEKLSLYAEKELSEKDSADLRAHVAACDECRRRQEFLQVFQSRLRDSLRAEVDCPDFCASIVDLLPERRRTPRLRLIFGFAASVCILAVVILRVLLCPPPTDGMKQVVSQKSPQAKRAVTTERVAEKPSATVPPHITMAKAPAKSSVANSRFVERSSRKPKRALVAPRLAVRKPKLVHDELTLNQPTPVPVVAKAGPSQTTADTDSKAITFTWNQESAEGEVSYDYTEEDHAAGVVTTTHTRAAGASIDVWVESTPIAKTSTQGMADWRIDQEA